MPRYQPCEVTASLACMSLAEVISPEIVVRKGDAAKSCAEQIEKKLRQGSTRLREERVVFPGDAQALGLNFLAEVPFMQVMVKTGNEIHEKQVKPGERRPQSESEPNSEMLPKALVLHLELSERTFQKGFCTQPKMHLMVDVFFNGQLASCSLIHMRDIVAEAKSLHQIFAGTRSEFLAEKPWIMWPASKNPTRLNLREPPPDVYERWKSIGRALLFEANERGVNKYGERPPSAEFLNALALMDLPDEVLDMEKKGGRKFGTIDVVITLGQGRKITSGASYLKAPQRMKDDHYDRKVKQDPFEFGEYQHAPADLVTNKDTEFAGPSSNNAMLQSSPWGQDTGSRAPSVSIPRFHPNQSPSGLRSSYDEPLPRHRSSIAGIGEFESSPAQSETYVGSLDLHIGSDPPKMPYTSNSGTYSYDLPDSSPFATTPFASQDAESSPMGRIATHLNRSPPKNIAPVALMRSFAPNLGTPFASTEHSSPFGSTQYISALPSNYTPENPSEGTNNIPRYTPESIGVSPYHLPRRPAHPSRHIFPLPYPSLSQGPLPPKGLFTVTQKPKANVKASKTPKTVNDDASEPSILVSRLVIAGKDGKTVVDHRWPVARRIPMNPEVQTLTPDPSTPPPVLSKQKSFGSAEYVESSATERLRGNTNKLATPPPSLSCNEINPDRTLSPVKTRRDGSNVRGLTDNAQRSGPQENTSPYGPLLHPLIDPALQHTTGIAAADSSMPVANLLQGSSPAPAPPTQPFNTGSLDALSILRLYSSSPLSSVPPSSKSEDGSVSETFQIFGDEEETKPPAHTTSTAMQMQMQRQAAQPILVRPEQITLPALNQAARDQALGTIETRAISTPKNKKESTPKSAASSIPTKRGANPNDSASSPAKRRRNAAAPAKHTKNPLMNKNCVIQYGMEYMLKPDIKPGQEDKAGPGLLRQIKGERQGVFKEEYVVFATRFFVVDI